METNGQLVERWRYLRALLTEQLDAIESGLLQIHSNDVNVSAKAITKLKVEIAEFDLLIAGDLGR